MLFTMCDCEEVGSRNNDVACGWTVEAWITMLDAREELVVVSGPPAGFAHTRVKFAEGTLTPQLGRPE